MRRTLCRLRVASVDIWHYCMQICAGSLCSEQRKVKKLKRGLKIIALKSIFVKFVIFMFIIIMSDNNDDMIIVMMIPDILKTWNLDQSTHRRFKISNCIEIDELQTLLEPKWKDITFSHSSSWP